MKKKQTRKLAFSKFTVANLREMSEVVAGVGLPIPVTTSSCDEAICLTVKYCGNTEINCSWPC